MEKNRKTRKGNRLAHVTLPDTHHGRFPDWHRRNRFPYHPDYLNTLECSGAAAQQEGLPLLFMVFGCHNGFGCQEGASAPSSFPAQSVPMFNTPLSLFFLFQTRTSPRDIEESLVEPQQEMADMLLTALPESFFAKTLGVHR